MRGAAWLYHQREWQVAGGGFTGAKAAPRSFGRQAPLPEPFRLTVDLSQDVFSKTWWRGAASLGALCVGLALLVPTPLPIGGLGGSVGADEAAGLRDLGVAPARLGGRSGGQMAASASVEPLLGAPERAQVELFVRLSPGDRLGPLLLRLGARGGDAVAVANLAAGQGVISPGASIAIRLGRDAGGVRPVERVAFRAGLADDIVISANASATGFQLSTRAIAVDERPQRIRGRVGDGLYWSLRAAGVEPATAADYLKALSTQLDVGADLGPDDRFDLIVANRRAGGQNQIGGLLYAGIQRIGGHPVELMKWSVGGKSGWYEASSLTAVASSGFIWPVNAPVTSEFGPRYHPILHFTRMHKGMDFGARWGTPIVASADGQVERAGWAGGYGRQVRLAHAGGIETSYSHMSRFVVEPGSLVRQGQLIGYSGTTGLSTGPHLHYETYRSGIAVNPRTVRFAVAAPAADDGQQAAFQARLKLLLGTARG